MCEFWLWHIHDCSMANNLWGVVSQAPACKTRPENIILCSQVWSYSYLGGDKGTFELFVHLSVLCI